jgi:hypothetical protein
LGPQYNKARKRSSFSPNITVAVFIPTSAASSCKQRTIRIKKCTLEDHLVPIHWFCTKGSPNRYRVQLGLFRCMPQFFQRHNKMTEESHLQTQEDTVHNLAGEFFGEHLTMLSPFNLWSPRIHSLRPTLP